MGILTTKKQSNSFIGAFFELFFPRTCNGCTNALNSNERAICSDCRINLPKTNWHNYKDNPLEKVFYGRVKVERATSFLFFEKDSIVQSFLHNLKYRNQKELGVLLGLYFGNDLKKANWIKDVDAVLPIPLHPKKLKLRGYNQSNLLGMGLSKSLKIPLESRLLKRIKNTDTQTRKNRLERQINLNQAFKCETTNFNSVLLVDDVSTTGATFESAINAIINSNPHCRIYVATLAMA